MIPPYAVPRKFLYHIDIWSYPSIRTF